MTDIILGEYPSEQGVAPIPIPDPVADVGTKEQPQPFDTSSQTVNDQQSAITGGEPIGLVDPRLRDDHLDAESAGWAVLDRETVGEGQGPNVTSLFRSKEIRVWTAVLLVGVLLVIVAPGVILGVLMKHVLMGIALSGAIATVIGTFAGFYYFQSKKG